MLKDGKRTFTIALFAIALAILVFFIAYNYLHRNHNWAEIYQEDSKEPYGGYVFAQLLKGYFAGKDFQVLDKAWEQKSVLTDTNLRNSNYVYLGKQCYLDSSSADVLLKYVERGNTATIVAYDVPYDLLKRLGYFVSDTLENTIDSAIKISVKTFPDTLAPVYIESTETTVTIDSTLFQTLSDSTEDDSAYKTEEAINDTPDVNETGYNYGHTTRDSLVVLNFTHPSLKDKQGYNYQKIINIDTVAYEWDFLFLDSFVPKWKYPYAVLGKFNENHVNFIKFNYGKGTFLFHTTPLAFTNYYLLDKHHLEYTEKVMSHLPNGNIYWDEYSRIEHRVSKSRNNNSGGDTPLRYILSQPALKWAWYIMLALVTIYFAFRLKRRQRIIPVLTPNANSSMEFADTISKLYFQQQDHRKIAIQEMKIFLAYLRNRYNINTSIDEKELIDKIAGKSGIDHMEIAMIFARYRHISDLLSISEGQLIEFHVSLETFYKNCK